MVSSLFPPCTDRVTISASHSVGKRITQSSGNIGEFLFRIDRTGYYRYSLFFGVLQSQPVAGGSKVTNDRERTTLRSWGIQGRLEAKASRHQRVAVACSETNHQDLVCS
jgi:hypothetical protein